MLGSIEIAIQTMNINIMDFDEYNMAISRIHNELQKIADRTLQQAWANCADWNNPMFRELMHRHTELTKLSSELTEKMFARFKPK